MSRRVAFLAALAALALIAAALVGIRINSGVRDVSGGDGGRRELVVPSPTGSTILEEETPEPGTVTAQPKRTDDVLTNPGMGFASFHFGWWCNLPPITYSPEECAKRVRQKWPENYPDSGTAYFRWHWRDLEPQRGEIAFDVIDTAIQSANRLGMTLSFRVMTVDEGKSGLPDWLTREPYDVAGEWRPGGGGKTFWPDYRDPTFQREHARFITALGSRYDGHPAVDSVDIGTAGCWGEWNTACLTDVDSIVEVYEPSGNAERKKILTALKQLIDHHLRAFRKTPAVMPALDAENVELLVHATRGGAGWRADCWGDWGMWGGSWSHQTKFYPEMIAAARASFPGFIDVWKRAPVQLEVCGTLSKWHDLGWTASGPDGKVHKTFQWALDQHASLLNAKSNPVPESYVAAVDELLKRIGYRFVVDRFNHPETIRAGSSTTFLSSWSNLGVAPAYVPRALTYRLRGESKTMIFASTQDTQTWLPGRWTVRDTIAIPEDTPAGKYEVEVALLDRKGSTPDTEALPPLFLGIAGRRPDGWYPVSQLTVE